MNRAWCLWGLSFALTASSIRAEVPDTQVLKPYVVYGKDDRRDLYQISDSDTRDLAAATVALVSGDDVGSGGRGHHKLKTKGYGPSEELCSGERFYEQEAAAFCSGFLVAPDIVLTAGHCLPKAKDCAKTTFVFDFAIHREGDDPGLVPVSSVYECAELIHTEKTKDVDFAVVRLDRPVTGRRPLEIDDEGPEAADTLAVIGHPSGLPTKVAGSARIRKIRSNSFIAELDAFDGNSGSAVLSAKSGKVVGVLISGEEDYVKDKERGCNRIRRCAANECMGETATRASLALEFIPPPRGKSRRGAPSRRPRE